MLTVTDPHGLRLALVERADALSRPFAAWRDSPVQVDYQVRGLDGARVLERELAPTARFAEEVLGFQLISSEHGWHRYGIGDGGAGQYLDVCEAASTRRGSWGIGAVHHLAWRVDDDAHQAEVRARVDAAGRRPTPVIDRFWFKSVYFLEPGGVLFELATDGPGFAVDESPGDARRVAGAAAVAGTAAVGHRGTAAAARDAGARRGLKATVRISADARARRRYTRRNHFCLYMA